METLSSILASSRNFKGLTRKLQIGSILDVLGESELDDAGILELGDLKIVVSTDGITEDLVKSDPWFAGYYSVLVNVNDILVKGAEPLGYVNVMSCPDHERRLKMAQGIKAGLDKYDLKLLKGHTHPDSSYDAIDAAVIGTARKVARSTTARPGDTLIIAMDLAGSFGVKGWVKCFDSTFNKPKEELKRMTGAIIELIQSGHIHASRDISAPGLLGSLAMLCEASSVGAEIDLEKIPHPERLPLSKWMTSYPAMGFIFAARSDPEGVVDRLRAVGFASEIAGRFTEDQKIIALLGGESGEFIDLAKESVFGLRRR